MKTLMINISDAHYDMLRDAAHRRGATVTSVAAAAVVATARQYDRPIAKLVVEAHARGLCVRDIAAEIGVTNKRVSDLLADLHLQRHPTPLVQKPVNPRARKVRA